MQVLLSINGNDIQLLPCYLSMRGVCAICFYILALLLTYARCVCAIFSVPCPIPDQPDGVSGLLCHSVFCR